MTQTPTDFAATPLECFLLLRGLALQCPYRTGTCNYSHGTQERRPGYATPQMLSGFCAPVRSWRCSVCQGMPEAGSRTRAEPRPQCSNLPHVLPESLRRQCRPPVVWHILVTRCVSLLLVLCLLCSEALRQCELFICKCRGSHYGSLSFQQTVTDAQRCRWCLGVTGHAQEWWHSCWPQRWRTHCCC